MVTIVYTTAFSSGAPPPAGERAYSASRGGARPSLTPGRLELTEEDLDHQGSLAPIFLDVPWEFYWQELIDPLEFGTAPNAAPEPDAFMPPTMPWNSGTAASPTGGTAKLLSDGYATYRLAVTLPDAPASSPEDPPLLALYVPSTHRAYELWADGVLLASGGIVGTDARDSRPETRAGPVFFHPEGPTVNLVLHTSNYHVRWPGAGQPIVLGSAEHIQSYSQWRAAGEAFLAGGLLIIGTLYLLIFGAMRTRRRQNASFLYFGFLAVVLAARTLAMGDIILSSLIPAFPWALRITVGHTAAALGIWMVGLFIQTLLPDEITSRTINLFSAASVAAAILMAVLPVRPASYVAPYMKGMLLAATVWAVLLTFRAALRRRPYAPVILAMMAAGLIALINDMARFYGLPSFGIRLVPVAVAAMLAGQGFIMAHQYSRAFTEQEGLAAEHGRLLAATRAQLADLADSRLLLTLREENLRRRISELLHARVQNRLLLAWYKLGRAKDMLTEADNGVTALLDDAMENIELVRDGDIRRAAHLLHPSIIMAGLVPAVRSLVADMPAHIEPVITIGPELDRLDSAETTGIPEILRLSVYRVLEEALNNVITHAEASRVHVSVTINGSGALRLMVADNGRGLARGEVRPGLGLASISSRIAQHGGEWAIEGYDGAGTCFTAEFPLPPVSETRPSSQKT